MVEYKKQHFIPKCYLKSWCDPNRPSHYDPYIWIFSKNGESKKKKSPEKSFVETDMFTIHDSEGNRDLILEQGLTELENSFARIRRVTLEKRKQLSEQDRLMLCAFVAAMFARTKAQRNHQMTQWGHVKEKMEKMREWAKTASAEEKKKMSFISSISSRSDAENPKMEYAEVKELAENPTQCMLSAMVQSLTVVFFHMGYLILEGDDEIGFITSDSPCVLFDPEAYKRPPLYRSGLMWPKIEITLPLSPSQLILFCHRDVGEYIQVGQKKVDDLNRRTRFYADKHFIVKQDKCSPIWFERGVEPEDSWNRKHKERK